MTTCTYAFIADIAAPEYRAMRMGLLSLTIFISYPIAMSLGGFIYEQGMMLLLSYIISIFDLPIHKKSNFSGGFVMVWSISTIGVAIGILAMILTFKIFPWENKKVGI